MRYRRLKLVRRPRSLELGNRIVGAGAVFDRMVAPCARSDHQPIHSFAQGLRANFVWASAIAVLRRARKAPALHLLMRAGWRLKLTALPACQRGTGCDCLKIKGFPRQRKLLDRILDSLTQGQKRDTQRWIQ
jgi:hypothetical protein